MADIQSNIDINIDTTNALSSIKNLQRQISLFHQGLRASGSAANAAISDNMSRNLINSINATKKFAASYATVQSATQSFTTSLEKNKFSMGQYFKYAAGSTKTFGRLFKTEFDTIERVAQSRVKSLQTQFIQLGRGAGGAVKAIRVRPLALDMEQLATKTAIAAQKQQLFNQLIKQGSTNLLNFGKNTQWAGRQLMVGFTVPLAYLGTTAARVFMDMEKQIIRLRRVYGDFATPSAETEKMVLQIKQLASEFTKYGVAVSKTMQLAADAASMGNQGAELIAQVSEANRLAILGGVEQAQALETTISVTNAFGVAAEDLAGKINFLNAVENQSVTSIEDLTIAIPKAGPVIKQLGGSVEDLAFFLTAMKEGGINASEGANALKSGLASIINPSQKASEFMQGFGISINGIVDANKGDVKGIVLGMADALDTLDPLNRARAIEQMFGKFQFARLSTLFQNVKKEGSQAETVLGLTKATSQELAILSERELKKVEDSPMFKFQKAVEDIKASLIPLGEQFLKLITPIIEFGTKALEQFNKLDSGVKNFIMGAIGVLGGLAPAAIMAFGLIANGIANLIKTGNFLRNMFVRAGQGTTILGQQTQYMTSEQLEAAAAAASLNQAHQKLTQQFTVEATAVRKLAAAYNDAAIAGARLTASGAISRGRAGGGKTKGYKSGVISVPGPKGAGDIVPAMLAPGEAVIPADKAKKYRGFISDMMQDRLPGFEDGNVKTGKQRTIDVGGQTYILPKPVSEETAERLRIETRRLHAYDPEIAAVTMTQLEQDKDLKSNAILGKFRQRALLTMDVYNGIGLAGGAQVLIPSSEDAKANLKLRETIRGADGKAEFKDLTKMVKAMPERQKEFDVATSISKGAFDAAIKMGMSEKDAIKKTGYDPKVNQYGVDRAHIAEVGVMKAFREMWKAPFLNLDPKIENGLMSTLATTPGQSKIVVSAIDDVMSSEKNPDVKKSLQSLRDKVQNNKTFSEAERKAFAMVTDHMVKNEGKYLNLKGLEKFKRTVQLLDAGYKATNLDQTYRVTMSDKDVEQKIKEEKAKKSAEVANARSLAAANKNKNVAPPETTAGGKVPVFKRMFRGKGYAKGVVSVPGPKGAGDVVPAMLSPGEAVIPAAMSKKYAPLIAGMVTDTLPGYAGGLLPPPPPSFDSSENPGKRSSLLNAGKDLAKGFAKNIIPAGKQMAVSLGKKLEDSKVAAKLGSKLLGGSITTTSGTTFTNGIEERRDKNGNPYYVQPGVGRVSKETAMSNQPSKEESRAARKELSRQRSGRMAQGAMGASMAMGALTMVPGSIGQAAATAMGPVAAFTAAISLIPGPIGLVVGALGALVVAVMQFNAAADETRKKTYETTKSMASSSESMKKLAEFAGTVSASEVAIRQRREMLSPFTVMSGKQTFGQSFLQSDTGQEQVSNTRNVLAQFGGKQAAQSLSSQLVNAIATKVITADQAKSIAQSVGYELNNYGLSIDVIGQINKILDEDGNVVENKTLTFFADIVAGKSSSGINEALTAALDNPNFKGKFEPFWWWEGETNAKAEGVVSGLLTGMFEEQQSAIDGFDRVRLAKIQSLKDSGQFAEAIEEEKRYQAERLELVKDSTKTINSYLGKFENLTRTNTQEAIVRQIVIDVKETYPNDSIMKMVLDTMESANDTSGMNLTAQLTFALGLKSGAIDASSMQRLLTMFDPNADAASWTKLAQLDIKLGTGTTDQVTQILESFGVFGKDAKQMRTSFLADLDFGNPLETTKKINALQLLSNYDGVVFKPGVDIQFYNNNDAQMDLLLSRFDQINELAKKGPITLESLIEQKLVSDPGSAEALAQMQKDFAGIPAGQKVQYAKTFTARMFAVATDEIKVWKTKNPKLAAGLTDEQIASRITQADTMEYMGTVKPDTSNAIATGENPDITKGSETNPLDELLKKLKNIRQAAVNADGGLNELKKWMKKGALEIQQGGGLVFQGIEQQLGKKGFNKNFIDFITSADKKTRELYAKISKTGKVTLTKAGEDLQNLFNALTIGDYERSVKSVVESSKKELDARKELLGLQMPYTEAVEASRDSGLAEAIAAIKASTNIKDKNKAIRQTINLYKEQKSAIENSKTAEEQFDDLFTKISKKFDADRNKISIDFELKTSGDKSIIAAAQNEINNVRTQLDDYNAGLTRLEPVEEAINKKYDDRIASLESIRDLNDRIAEQKNAELDISAALARGDVGAAAEAIQKEQQRQSKEAMDAKIKNLENQREAELNKVTTRVQVNGQTLNLTKEEINKRIKDLEMQIFNIEEDRLEPAQTRIDLAMYERDVKLKALDDEKLKWDQLKNNIDLAATAATNYKDILAEAQLLASQAQLDYTNPNPGANDEMPAGGGGGRAVAYSLYAKGGMVMGSPEPPPKMMAAGGMVKPSYFGFGGMARGTDTVPAMLTPGEFIMSKYAVDAYGVDTMKAMNSGELSGGSVYNSYEVNVNVRSDANPDQIARAVMGQIKQINSQQLRGNRF